MPYDQSAIDKIHKEVDSYIKSKRAFPPTIQVSPYQFEQVRLYEKEEGPLLHDFRGYPTKVYIRATIVPSIRPRR